MHTNSLTVTALGAAAALFASATTQAGIVTANGISVTTSPDTNDANDAEILTSIILPDTTVLSVLTPATHVSGSGGGSSNIQAFDLGAPLGTAATTTALLSDLDLTSGVLGTVADPNGANGATFTFGRGLAANEIIYNFELQAGGSNDDYSWGLIDSAGDLLDFTLQVNNIGGPSDRLFNSTVAGSNGGAGGGIVGLTFTVGDFTDGIGTAYTGTDAHGLTLLTNTGSLADLTAVGIAAVPEPASLALVGLGGAMMLGRRRA